MGRILRHIFHIVRTPSPLSRSRLLATYFRLKLKHLILVKLLHVQLTRERIFGKDIFFYHYPTLVSLFEEIFLYQEYWPPNRTQRHTIIDCGANVGVSVLFFSLAYPGCRILAFEADEDSFRALQKTCAGLPNITALNRAVCDSEGTREFHYDSQHPGLGQNSLYQERFPKGSSVRKVQCTRLSSSIASDIDFLKMDIEGAEYEVLNEVAQAGKLTMIGEMIIEYHHHIVREEDSFSRLLALLERAGFGYQIMFIYSGTSLPPTYQDIGIYAYRK